jgi:hypothetical protein
MDKCCVIRSKKLGRNIFSKSHNEYIVAFFNSGYVAWSYTLVHESFSILHICIYEVTQGFLIIIYCNTMEKCFGTRRDNHGTSLCVFKILIHIFFKNFKFAMVSKNKARFSLGMTHGGIGTITSTFLEG